MAFGWFLGDLGGVWGGFGLYSVPHNGQYVFYMGFEVVWGRFGGGLGDVGWGGEATQIALKGGYFAWFLEGFREKRGVSHYFYYCPL